MIKIIKTFSEEKVLDTELNYLFSGNVFDTIEIDYDFPKVKIIRMSFLYNITAYQKRKEAYNNLNPIKRFFTLKPKNPYRFNDSGYREIEGEWFFHVYTSYSNINNLSEHEAFNETLNRIINDKLYKNLLIKP